MLSSDGLLPFRGATLITGNARLSRLVRHDFDLKETNLGERS
jgi:hypothetical protein